MKKSSSDESNHAATRSTSSRLLSLWSPKVATIVFLAACFVVAYASADPPGPYPPEDDPSAFTGPFVEPLPDGLPEANEGSFEGGETGTSEDAGDNNVLQLEDQREDGTWNVPTNGPPSPLFGAGSSSSR